jgi:hypothetical protein
MRRSVYLFFLAAGDTFDEFVRWKLKMSEAADKL